MTMNIEQKLQQLEDRIAIRELIDQYTYCADTRDAQGQMSLFTADTNFEVFMDGKSSTPTQVINNRQDLFPVFDNLNAYLTTMHFNGQTTIKLDGNRANGITYCRAYYLNKEEGGEKLMIAGRRYDAIIVKQDDQ